MVRVMASGVFDIIHTGHISFLEQAKSLGDELVVVVACDNTVKKRKHEPINSDIMRCRVISALKPVDIAVIGKDTGDFFSTVKEINPDIIVLGFDQTFDEKDLENQLRENGFETKVVRASGSPNAPSTSNIIAKIIDSSKKAQ